MRARRTTAYRASAWAALLVTAAALASGASVARGDKASAALAKYKRPVEQSVDRALAFLAKRQLTGKQAEAYNSRFKGRRDAVDLTGTFLSDARTGNTGVSGLCIMAFLAAGHTPGHGPYGKVIDRGIDYLIRTQQGNGVLVNNASGRASQGPMYAHCIATLTLAEVSGMVSEARQKRLDATLPKALEVILKAQKVRKDPRNAGGWRYQPTSGDSDMSLTGWAIMALRAGRLNGAGVPKEAIGYAVEYILKCRPHGGGDGSFGYQAGSGSKEAMTGAAILCLSLCGEHKNKALLRAGDWLYSRAGHSRGGSHYYYGMYYCSQAMFQLGGKYWERWAAMMYKTMLKEQLIDGSWTKYSGHGPCYGTAMGVLAMTVSYRQLPIYQR